MSPVWVSGCIFFARCCLLCMRARCCDGRKLHRHTPWGYQWNVVRRPWTRTKVEAHARGLHVVQDKTDVLDGDAKKDYHIACTSSKGKSSRTKIFLRVSSLFFQPWQLRPAVGVSGAQCASRLIGTRSAWAAAVDILPVLVCRC